MGFNLFGSSKGDSSTTYDNRQDNSVVEGDLASGAIRAGGDVTVTDGGAFDLVETTAKEVIDLSRDVSAGAFDLSRDQTDIALDFGRDSLGIVADNAAETFNAISENNRRTYDLIEGVTNEGAAVSENSRYMMLGLVLVAGLAIWRAAR